MKPITFPLSTLILLATSLLTTLGTEQVCSSYDYEEKLLAKTIRLENTIEDLMNKTTEMETSFTMELETLETEIEKLNTRLNGMEYDTKTCPSNYMYSEALKLCWRLESTKVHWFDAVKLCSDEGARLIIFNSTDQASLVKEYIRAGMEFYLF